MQSTRTTGKSCPIYVGGILYSSIFEASIESGISSFWILNRLKTSKGKPVFIRGTAVVEREWVQQILAAIDYKHLEAEE